MSGSEGKISLGPYGIYRDSKSKYWQVRATAEGKKLFKSTGEIDAAKAKVRARVLYNDWIRDDSDMAPRHFVAVSREFVSLRAGGNSSTSKRIHNAVFNLTQFFNCKLSQVEDRLPEYLKTNPGYNELKYLKAIFRFAFSKTYIKRVPAFKIPKQNSPGAVYTDDEIKRLLTASADSESLRLAIIMGFTMGLRVGEIMGLELSRIDLQNRTITFESIHTKTKHPRTVSMSAWAIAIIEPRVSRLRGTTPWLFPLKSDPTRHMSTNGLDNLWQAAKTKAGVRGRFHDLRHSCATRMAKAGVSSKLACSYLGMSLRMYDTVYSHLNSQDTAHLAQVVQLGGLDVD